MIAFSQIWLCAMTVKDECSTIMLLDCRGLCLTLPLSTASTSASISYLMRIFGRFMVVFFCRFSDEISFDRLSLARVRRAADAAAAAIGSPFTPLFDLHTGGGAQDPSPPACSYAGHYPFMDYVWNGEDFTFGSGPDYWLIEISSRRRGVTGDLLGSGSSGASVFQGMLYGMVDRDFCARAVLVAILGRCRDQCNDSDRMVGRRCGGFCEFRRWVWR